MPRPRKSVPEPPATPSPQARWKGLAPWLVPLVAGVALIAGLLVFGRLAHDGLRGRGTHRVAFADTECDPPPGLSREEFLDEVQYLGGLPDQLDLFDGATNARIVQAMRLHPWVRAVRRIEQRPHRIAVDLEYRVPVLAVARPARAVDAAGVLLPTSANVTGLPVLQTQVVGPKGKPGEPWGDIRVEAAAAVAHLLAEHLETLQLRGCQMEVDLGAVVLRTANTRIIWGMPPGHEREDETPAAEKLRRLLASGKLAGHSHDLRPQAGMERRPLED